MSAPVAILAGLPPRKPTLPAKREGCRHCGATTTPTRWVGLADRYAWHADRWVTAWTCCGTEVL